MLLSEIFNRTLRISISRAFTLKSAWQIQMISSCFPSFFGNGLGIESHKRKFEEKRKGQKTRPRMSIKP
uniref:Uncharacterized protein n=1 Tax=Rhizophora mucronata TaxID=61149 RepID=A0A2P2NV11_RHIMU